MPSILDRTKLRLDIKELLRIANDPDAPDDLAEECLDEAAQGVSALEELDEEIEAERERRRKSRKARRSAARGPESARRQAFRPSTGTLGGGGTRKSMTGGSCTGADCACDDCRANTMANIKEWLPQLGSYGIYRCNEDGTCTFSPRIGS